MTDEPAAVGPRLTRRGWAAAAAASVMVIAGSVVGIVELYAVAVADLSLLVATTAWVALRRWSLEVRRELHPPRVEVGGTVSVDLVIRNLAGSRSPTLSLTDPCGGGGATRLRLAPLAAGEAERGTYRISLPRRGRVELGPLRVALADPFGLVSMVRSSAGASVVHVHPRIERLHALPPSGGEDRRSGEGTLAPASAGDEFFALRPYRVGDDLRRVHWAATARGEELMIRQDQSTQRSHLTVAVDLREASWDAATPSGAGLETALSAAASITAASLRAGLDVRFVTTGDTDTGWVGPGGLDRVLDALAAVTSHGGAGRPLAHRLAGGSDALVVIGSASFDVTPLIGGAARVGTGSLTVVTVAPDPRADGRSVPWSVRLVAGQPVALAWDAAVGRAGQVRAGA